MKIAIIGAGFGGVHIGKSLTAKGQDVTIFEKARGIGGRMSTRKADEFAFDHGAQCFTARSDEFKSFLTHYEKLGLVQEWEGKAVNFEQGKKVTKRKWVERHLVSSPAMNSLAKAIGEGLDIKLSTEVAPLTDYDGKHRLKDINGNLLGEFDWVISTAPPVQTANLFPKDFGSYDDILKSEMHCCFALMLGFKKEWDKSWNAARVRNSKIKWISVNSSKPGRDSNVTCFVIHSQNNWSDKNVETDQQEVTKFMLEEFRSMTGLTEQPDYISLHRWKYAIIGGLHSSLPLIDRELKLAATSDWCSGSRIEDVWISAESLISHL